MVNRVSTAQKRAGSAATTVRAARTGSPSSPGAEPWGPDVILANGTRAAGVRHAVVGLTAVMLSAGFWWSRPQWAAEMRIWRAFGDAAVVLLFVSLALGPVSRLWRPGVRLLRWRRETGVWCAVASLVHAALVLHGWARWSVERLVGFEFVPQLNRTARLEPGFGLANLMGLVALAWLLILAVTSSDRAVRALGPAAWKWLQTGAYVVFYLSVLHAGYFLFLHYSLSFHKPPAPSNWFRWPLVVMGLTVVALQFAAFARTAVRKKRRPARR